MNAALVAGRLEAKKNPDVQTKSSERSIDLIMCEKGTGPAISVRLSVENKTIMTAHGKARKNRYGDIIAYSNHMHDHRPDCIAGAIVVVNISPRYENPDSFARGLQRPDLKMDKVVMDTIGVFARIPLRNGPGDPIDQPEALAVIVVDYDGLSPAKLVRGELAPAAGTTMHYESFVGRIGDLYERRFNGR